MGYRFTLTISTLLFLFTQLWTNGTIVFLSPKETFASQCNRANTIYEIRAGDGKSAMARILDSFTNGTKEVSGL